MKGPVAFLALLVLFSLSSASPLVQDLSSTSISNESLEKRPWFCHDLDCPHYKVLDKTDEYEVRRYKEGTETHWFSSSSSSSSSSALRHRVVGSDCHQLLPQSVICDVIWENFECRKTKKQNLIVSSVRQQTSRRCLGSDEGGGLCLRDCRTHRLS